MNSIGLWYAAFTADFAGFIAPMKEAQQQSDAFVKSMKPLRQELMDLGSLMAVAGGAVTATIGVMVDSAAKLGEEFAKASAKTGSSVEDLSKLSFAAEQTGSSFDDLTTGMKKLAQATEGALNNTGTGAKAFADLGISVRDTNGQMFPLQSILLQVADRFSTMKDGTLKTADAVALFGRNGTSLIPLLDQGRAGIEAFGNQAAALGVVLTEEDAKAAEQLEQNFKQIDAATTGLGNALLSALTPALNTSAQATRDAITAVTGFVRAHQTLTEGIAVTAAALGTGGTLMVGLGTLLQFGPKIGAAFSTAAGFLTTAFVPALAVVTTAIAAVGVGEAIRDWTGLGQALDSIAEKFGKTMGDESDLKTATEQLREKVMALGGGDQGAVPEGGKALADYNTKLIQVMQSLNAANPALQAQRAAIENLTAAARNNAYILDQLREGVADQITADQAHAKYVDQVTAAFQKSLRPADDLNKALDALKSAGMADADILQVYGKQIVAASAEQEAHGIAVSGTTAKLHDQAVALQNLQALVKQFSAQPVPALAAPIPQSLPGEYVGPIGQQAMSQLEAYEKQIDDLNSAVKAMDWLTPDQEIALFSSQLAQVKKNAQEFGLAIPDATQALIDHQTAAADDAAQTQQWTDAVNKGTDAAAAAALQIPETNQAILNMQAAGYSADQIISTLGSDITTAADNAKLFKIPLDSATQALKDQMQAAQNSANQAAQWQKMWSQATNKITNDFSSGIASMITQGKSFSSVMQNIFKDLADSIVKSLVTGAFQKITGGLQRLLGGMSSSSLGAFLSGSGSAPGSAGGSGLGILGGAGGAAGLSGLWTGTSTATYAGMVPGGIEGALGLGGGAGLFGLGAATIPVVGGAIAGIALLINHFVGEGRKTANEWVQGFQNPFGTQLENLVNSFDAANAAGSLTLDQASQTKDALTQLIQAVTSQASQFASQGGENQTVIDQFWNTMTTDFGSNFQKIFDDFNGAISKLQAQQGSAAASATSATTATSSLTVSSTLTNDAVTQLSTEIAALTEAMTTLVAHISPTGLLPATGLATSASQVFADAVGSLGTIFENVETRFDSWLTKLEGMLPAVGAGLTSGPGNGVPINMNFYITYDEGSIQIKGGGDLSTVEIREVIESQLVTDVGNDSRGFGTQLKHALGIA